jgi:putative FmdB family regulatory protein
MPIYEYNCQDCKQIFEEWQKDYEERDIPCPVCGGKATRLISSTSFVLKGGGWYANGYSEAGSATSSGSATSGPATSPGSADSGAAKPAANAAPATGSTASTGS